MLEFKRKNPTAVANPNTGNDVLFLDTNGVYYTKNDQGQLKVLGNGIKSLTKVGTSGLVDTYRITFDDNSVFDYTVTNARSIVDIIPPANPGQPGATDTYQIDFNDGPNDTFIVYNGANGLNGQGQPAQNNPSKIDPDDTASIGTRTAFYALEDHQHQIDAAAPVALGDSNQEGTSAAFARADHVHVRPTLGELGVLSFTNIAVSGQNTVVADSSGDTLTLVAGTGITLTTDSANDSVTITGTVQAPQNTFSNVSVGTTPTPTLLQADLAADTLTVNAGAGISLTADAGTDTYTINNTGVTSVNGQTGAVVIPLQEVTTRTAPTASFSTAVTTVISQAITGGSIVAGSMFEFMVRAQVINTTAASNLVATISIGATNVLVATQALGTTARASPGGTVIIEGTISFSSATAAEATARAFASSAVAFDAAFGTTAAVTVATATNTTADIKLNTSAATSTVIVREAYLSRIK